MRYVYPPLLGAGVHIREWTRSVLHAKAAVVDGRKLLVGSINLDPLSLVAMEALVEADHDGAAALGESWMQHHFALAAAVEVDSRSPAGMSTWIPSLLATVLGWARRWLERLLVRNRERLGRGMRER
jgi:cardiolipin synthase